MSAPRSEPFFTSALVSVPFLICEPLINDDAVAVPAPITKAVAVHATMVLRILLLLLLPISALPGAARPHSGPRKGAFRHRSNVQSGHKGSSGGREPCPDGAGDVVRALLRQPVPGAGQQLERRVVAVALDAPREPDAERLAGAVEQPRRHRQ